MKALVLEIREDKAAILTSEGQIIKVDNKQYRVGQEITFKGPKEKIVDMTRHVKKWGTAIAAALFLFVSLGVSYAVLKPYGVVSLDVNPSIEFTINRFDHVLRVNGVNDDGKDILACLDEKQLLHKDIEKAIDITLDTLRAEGYLKEEKDNYVVVAANTVEESHTDKLVGKLDESMARQDNIEPISMKASDDELMAAREMGTTAGKMMIVEKLDDSSKEKINKDKWINKSVAAIVKECDKNTAGTVVAAAEETKSTGQVTGASAAVNNTNANTAAGSNNSSSDNTGKGTTSGYLAGVAANSGSKSGSSDKSKKSSSKKSSGNSEGTSSQTPAASAPNMDNNTTVDVSVVGASSNPTAAPTPAASAGGNETPAVTADPTATPAPTSAPTTIPVTDPTAIPTAAPVTPETPVVQPSVPETPVTPVVVEPSVTPSDPAPSQPSEPSQPSQPSEPSTPETPSETPVPDSGSSPSSDQAQPADSAPAPAEEAVE